MFIQAYLLQRAIYMKGSLEAIFLLGQHFQVLLLHYGLVVSSFYFLNAYHATSTQKIQTLLSLLDHTFIFQKRNGFSKVTASLATEDLFKIEKNFKLEETHQTKLFIKKQLTI